MCFSVDKNIKYYTYNKTTGLFGKCYNSCEFCSIIIGYSYDSSYNCLACKDGYLPSYTYQGNYYKIDENAFKKNEPKIAENSTNSNFAKV